MNVTTDTFVLAIDGGGTRCRVACDQGGVVTTVETGAANVSSDFDGTLNALRAGLDRLADQLGCSAETLAERPAFVGLAGVTGPAIADRLRAALPLRRVRVVDDRPAALRGALGARDGVIAHCGTGSFYGAQIAGKSRLSGGWGPVVGDEASAQWVGRAALRLTLESVDGRRITTPLTRAILDRFGDAAGVVRFAGTARPFDLGGLAPLVTGHGAEGDATAEGILRHCADDIAHALRCIGWVPGLAICLTGGIGPHFADWLPDEMRADLAQPAGAPLDGALALARDYAAEVSNERG